LFGTTGYCAACNKVIPAFEMVMRAKNNVYHLECFACHQCNHRFCVGDRFYLCENKILCEYDYEERLVFANMAYNPSSLAHIRRQVSNLQQAGDNLTAVGEGRIVNSPSCYSEKNSDMAPQGPLRQPISVVNHRDDGSSGYGSPDSETFETLPHQ
ncbi:LIM/homeobox protein Lhx3-like, partial [Anoplophora glabripennis]